MNNKIVKPVEQEIKNYYDVLEKRCVEEKCCLASLKIMKENNYKKVDQDGKCIDGFEMNTVIWKECPQVLEWCEPIKNEYCLKDGEKRERLKDKCCGESKFYVDGNYISGTKLCVASQYSICLNCGNGICGIGENGCNCPKDCIKENDISNWQTYRNEEFGIKFKYGKKDTEIKIEKNKITATFNKEPYYNFNGEIIVFEKSKDETIEHAIEKIIKEEDINLEDCKIITKKQNMSENSNNINISVLLKEDYEPSDDEVMAEIGYIDSLENLDFICETTPECEWAKQKLLEERTELKCSQYAGCFGYKCLSNFVYQPNNSKQKFIYIKARKGTPSFWKWDSIEILKNEPDTSDWQTYRNEEFGF
ncbi:MAG: hypothetical protein U9Q27_00430, partial [Patescibacteria group bacterium]|nr:hypothetical protein [Patescibacteria group bacterium]